MGQPTKEKKQRKKGRMSTWILCRISSRNERSRGAVTTSKPTGCAAPITEISDVSLFFSVTCNILPLAFVFPYFSSSLLSLLLFSSTSFCFFFNIPFSFNFLPRFVLVPNLYSYINLLLHMLPVCFTGFLPYFLLFKFFVHASFLALLERTVIFFSSQLWNIISRHTTSWSACYWRVALQLCLVTGNNFTDCVQFLSSTCFVCSPVEVILLFRHPTWDLLKSSDSFFNKN